MLSPPCWPLLLGSLLLGPAACQEPPPGPATAPSEPGADTAPKPSPLPRELTEVLAAYAAKVAASAVFVSDRTLDSVRAEEFAPDGALQALARPFLQFEVDREARAVTASLLGSKATAVFVPGLGCTLANGASPATLRARALPEPDPTPPRDGPWPLGDDAEVPALPDDVDADALGAALDFAFADREGRAPARTRAVVVCRDGRLLAERYAAGYDRDSVLPGWSMTKTWVLALLGLRVRDGALDPDAALPVPEWQQDPLDPRRALRLWHLLRMHSGLAWTEDYEAPQSDALRMLFASSDYAGVAAAQPLAAAPATVHRYSSGTTNLLCRILRATFRDDAAYRAYPHDRLFAPLGMRSAVLEPDPSGTFVGSSFGFATARDWARFGQFLLQDGVQDGERLLPAGWVDAAREPAAASRRGGYGGHLWLNAGAADAPADRPMPELPRDLFYLSGYEGQYVVVLPTERLVLVRLGCTRSGGFSLGGFVQRVLAACAK